MIPDKKDHKKDSVLLNERIGRVLRASEVQLITHEGVNMKRVPFYNALGMAQEAGLDLVLLAEKGSEGIPLVKIMDHGKQEYEKKKSRKQQKVIQIKEVKLRPKIGEHDFHTKMNQVVQFLKEGKRVKMTVLFRGREMANKQERGTELFEKVDRAFEDKGLASAVAFEGESKMGQLWSRVYYLKQSK